MEKTALETAIEEQQGELDALRNKLALRSACIRFQRELADLRASAPPLVTDKEVQASDCLDAIQDNLKDIDDNGLLDE